MFGDIPLLITLLIDLEEENLDDILTLIHILWISLWTVTVITCKDRFLSFLL